MTWVAFDTDVSRAITTQMHFDPDEQVIASPPALDRAPSATEPQPPAPGSPQPSSIIRIEIGEANLRNNHFYLRDHVHKFPDDVIGGSNKSKAAKQKVTLDWGGPELAQTDIDGEDKKFFRARGWVSSFYRLNEARAGDFVVIEPIEPYRYRVKLEKAA